MVLGLYLSTVHTLHPRTVERSVALLHSRVASNCPRNVRARSRFQNSSCDPSSQPSRVLGSRQSDPGGSAMFSSKFSYLSASLLFAALLASPAAHAQTPSNCVASQAAAVECFVANSVKTDLFPIRHGMTLAQYEAYGVAVSNILHTEHTYLVLVGLSSAIADAMPPTNADGSANIAAQNLAVDAISYYAAMNNLVN